MKEIFRAKLFNIFFPNRNIAYLFSGQIVSQIGDSIYQIGLMWLVLELTRSKSAVGTVAMISYLPMLLFGFLAGSLVDMYDRRKVMIVSDLLRALVVLMIPVSFFTETISLPIIICVSFTMATLSTVFNPARDAVLPDLVNKNNLLKANSLVQISNFSAILIGPALGAILIGALGVVHLFTFDSLTFLFSFAAIFLIRCQPSNSKKNTVTNGSFVYQFHEILHYIRGKRKLLFLLGLTAINNFFIMGPAIVGTPIFVKEVLNEEATSYALVESCLGLGMILGSILVNYLSRYFNKIKMLLLGLMFDGLTHTLVYYTESLGIFMGLIAFHAIGIPFIVVSRTTLIQEWTEDKKLGRIFSLVNMSVIGMTALTTGATGWLADYISIRIIFGAFGIAAALCGVVGWCYKDFRNN